MDEPAVKPVVCHVAAGVAGPFGHYSHAVEANGLLFVSGILGIGPGESADSLSVEAQADRCLGVLDAVLRHAGTDLSRVVKLNVFISDLAHWAVVNQRCAAHFGAHRPARTIVPVNGLHYGAAIEADAIAALR